MTYKDKALEFLGETQFHLGDLITEQSHPVTKDLSTVLNRDRREGVKQLLSVDRDIPSRAEEVFASPAYGALKEAIAECLERESTIYFSGCGSTGRLAILLESMWRRFWIGKGEPGRAERSCSIMTGGDRALIRSVENFEDFMELGRQQSRDNNVAEGDLFIAVSEGGETSSVIGTALEAADLGARVFFLYNNPDEILKEKVERSRTIIEDDRVTTINLTTGPMALAGSTRMQATTMELFVIGTALESVCSPNEKSLEREKLHIRLFREYLENLMSPKNLEVLASLVEMEEKTYGDGSVVTYISDIYLLDIFSDTTERTPTFMLPAFRKRDDLESPMSWAFAKDPLRGTEEAWSHMLQRTPRGLEWNSADYKRMNSPAYLVENPPKLDLQEIYSYNVGFEPDRPRKEKGRLVCFDLLDSRSTMNRKAVLSYYDREKSQYNLESLKVTIGPGEALSKSEEKHISMNLEETPMFLFWHIFFKLILNTVSTGTMGCMGRIRGNWMIQVDATNKKLIDRSCRIVSSLTGCTYEKACTTLFRLMDENREESRKDNRGFVVMAIEEIEKGN